MKYIVNTNAKLSKENQYKIDYIIIHADRAYDPNMNWDTIKKHIDNNQNIIIPYDHTRPCPYEDILDKVIISILPHQMLKTPKDVNTKVFLSTQVTNWADFYFYATSEVFDYLSIGGELLFDLKKVSQVAQKYNIKLFAEFHPISKYTNIKEYPFIRPEDVDYYNKYIEAIYLYSENSINTIYSCYENKRFIGNLRILFDDNNIDIPNSGILPIWANIRSNCQQKCLKGNDCSICQKVVNLSQSLTKKNLVFFKENKENG